MPADFPQLWSAFFQPGARNLMGFGVPLFYDGRGIYVRDVQVNAPGREGEGRIDEFVRKMNLTPRPTDDTYNGVGDVVVTNLVASFFAASGTTVKVTNARTIAESEDEVAARCRRGRFRYETVQHAEAFGPNTLRSPETASVSVSARPLSRGKASDQFRGT